MLTSFNAADEITVTEAFKVDPFAGVSRGDVAKQWSARPADQRFLNLDDMRRKLRERAENTVPLISQARRLEFVTPEIRTIDDTNALGVGLPTGEVMHPTHWSFGQLATLAEAPAGYLRKLPSPIVADCLRYGMLKLRNVEEVKTYSVDGELRAAVGPNYGWIKDADVVEAVQQIAGSGTGDARWKVPGVIDWSTHMYDPFSPVTLDSTTLYASDRDVFIFLVDDTHPIEVGKLRDGSPDYMFRGFFVSNSEVGAGSMRLAAFYLRAVCMNRNLWGVERFNELTIRHTSGAPARFMHEARPALASFADNSQQKLIDGVIAAKEAIVAREESEALTFLRNRGFSQKRAKAIMMRDSETGAQRDEGDFPRSAWDMAQAITADARSALNADTRIAMEEIAGKILDKVA